ncbi:MAG: S9 family peptidase [Verrucomicrobiae bacterium]|nr:S9 family peptidase [Verrucomicrobiae bacterium]
MGQFRFFVLVIRCALHFRSLIIPLTVKNQTRLLSLSRNALTSFRSRTRLLVAGWSFLLLLSAGLPSQAATDVLTPHRVAELRHVSSAVISPDGSRVAYTLSVPRKPNVDEDGEPWIELWVTDSREGEARPFITGKVNVSSVHWTVDGRQIAFLAKRGDDKNRSLYLIPVDGGEARKAAELASDISSYSLATDGQRVALVASEAEKEATKKLKDKGFKAEIYEEDWRPARIWLATLFDLKTNTSPLALEGHVYRVHWSPVDDRLLVALAPTPAVDDSFTRQQVRIVDSKTGEILTRINNPGKLGSISWSPDGRRVGLNAAADIHDPDAGRLMVADASDGTFRDLLPGLEGSVRQFEWADKDTIRYIAAVGVQTVFAGVNASTGVRTSRPVLEPVGPILGDLSLSADGQQAALVASTPTHPAELFTWKQGDAAPKRRTESNPSLEKIRFARQEVIRHKARDGLELEGVLIRPLDEAAGKRYPLILSVHGGPEAHISHGWLTGYNLPGQVAAARGMAVFYPNYRGSTGRGVAFSKLGQGDAAGKEFDDLVDAVDHLISIGLVDRTKVGITGGSYGGYATAWCSTRYSERFAAGVMFVGISDKISKVGTTDIPNEEYYVHALKRPWEDWQFLLERSPIYHAAQGRTPLLILHGKDDPRVNVGQSRELYRHLKLHNQAPVRLVLYPGEVHGNRKAAARLDYHLRSMQWMEHYLKGPGGEMPAMEIDHADPTAPNEASKKTES